MDNRIFNVNGKGLALLEATLRLVFAQKHENTKTKGWIFDKDKGLVLLWCECDGQSEFIAPLNAAEVTPMIGSWLNGEQAKSMKFDEWDQDADHDGHNTLGWRVYCEDWGHVGDRYQAICAVRPAYMWHGK